MAQLHTDGSWRPTGTVKEKSTGFYSPQSGLHERCNSRSTFCDVCRPTYVIATISTKRNRYTDHTPCSWSTCLECYRRKLLPVSGRTHFQWWTPAMTTTTTRTTTISNFYKFRLLVNSNVDHDSLRQSMQSLHISNISIKQRCGSLFLV